MSFLIKKILQFIFLIFGIYFVYKVIIKKEKLFTFRSGKKEKSEKTAMEEMKKDPVCGTYIPEKNSLKLKSGGETFHFCSEKCREHYIETIKKDK
ncbi:MAG: YHS domain-containing protein [Acidobacteriota bacterium]